MVFNGLFLRDIVSFIELAIFYLIFSLSIRFSSLFLYLKDYFRLSKLSKKNILFVIILASIFSIVTILYTGVIIGEMDNLSIFLSVLVNPFIEEILIRLILLSSAFYVIEKKENFVIFLIVCGLFLFFELLPFLVGLANNFHSIMILVFCLVVISYFPVHNKLRKIFLIVIQALIFLLIHQVNVSSSIFLVGLICGVLVYKYKNIFYPILFHMVTNIWYFLFTLIF